MGEDLADLGAELVLAKLRSHRVRHLWAKCRHALQLLVADSIPALAAVVRA